MAYISDLGKYKVEVRRWARKPADWASLYEIKDVWNLMILR